MQGLTVNSPSFGASVKIDSKAMSRINQGLIESYNYTSPEILTKRFGKNTNDFQPQKIVNDFVERFKKQTKNIKGTLDISCAPQTQYSPEVKKALNIHNDISDKFLTFSFKNKDGVTGTESFLPDIMLKDSPIKNIIKKLNIKG